VAKKKIEGIYNVKNVKTRKRDEWFSVDTEKLNPQVLEMKKIMEAKVIGQRKAINELTKSLTRAMVKLEDPKKCRPLGNFIFLGPTGVGKTEAAKAVAEVHVGYFGALTYVNCAEFGQQHTVLRLVGAPPSYIGYGDMPLLAQAKIDAPFLEYRFPEFKELNRKLKTLEAEYKKEAAYNSNEENEVKKKEIKALLKKIREFRKKIGGIEIPSVILFDEVEKACPEFFRILLSIFEEGQLSTTTHGVTSFKNSIIILTGNIEGKEISNLVARKGKVGFEVETRSPERLQVDIDKKVEEGVSKIFPDEFIGRVNGNGGIIAFSPLTDQEKFEIAELQITNFALDALGKRYAGEEKIIIQYYAKELIPFILSRTNPKFGARDIIGVLQANVFNPFKQAISSGGIVAGDVVHFAVENNQVKFIRAKRQPKATEGKNGQSNAVKSLPEELAEYLARGAANDRKKS